MFIWNLLVPNKFNINCYFPVKFKVYFYFTGTFGFFFLKMYNAFNVDYENTIRI